MSVHANKVAPYQEVEYTVPVRDGRMVTVSLRDALVPEHCHLSLTKAFLISKRLRVSNTVEPISRSLKDMLIKTSIQI